MNDLEQIDGKQAADQARLDETQMGVLGCLLSGSGMPGENLRDARAVQQAGGLELFPEERFGELWRRIESALNDGKEPHVYKHVKQVYELDKSFVEEIIDRWAVSGLLLEQTYLPELVKCARERRVKSAMREALETGDITRVSAILKEASALPTANTKNSDMAEIVGEWQESSEHPGELSGIPCGLNDLDRKTAGWQNGTLTIVGARPSQGKTALLIGFARHAAIEKEIPAVFFSLESSSKEIIRRLLCQITGADQTRLRFGMATEGDMRALPQAISRVRRAPIEIIDCPGASIGWLKAEARKLKEQMGARIIFVDYLQKIKAEHRNEKKTYEIAQVSGGLKEMADELNVPVICAGQLNREPEKAKGRPPMLSDLADCGQIERDADIVALKHLFFPKGGGNPVHQLILAKFRDGPGGTVSVAFTAHCARFDNLCPIDPADYNQPHND